MYGNLGDGVTGIIYFLMVLCAIFIPLGIWKLIEIIIYLTHHISIGLK